ncbi:MAG: cysteine hydrolase [Pseudohongiellaceae bacterium]
MKERREFEPFPVPRPTDRIDSARCDIWQRALLCIDLQTLGCVEGYGVFESHRNSGVSEDSIQYYLERVHHVVIPNVQRLQAYFRLHKFEVIHCRIQSLTADGRDRSLEHKRLGLHAPPGSKLAEFLPEVAPQNDEIVVNKTASGLFISTNMEFILRNLCISELFIAGVYTNECVASAARSASDLGFDVRLISDGAAAITPGLHRATLMTMKDRYAKVMTTEEAIAALDETRESEQRLSGTDR